MMVGMFFWALIALGAVALVARVVSTRSPHLPETPLEILKRRLAAGEINPDEFERRRQTMEAPAHA